MIVGAFANSHWVAIVSRLTFPTQSRIRIIDRGNDFYVRDHKALFRMSSSMK